MTITGNSDHSTDNHSEASINDQINIEKKRIESLEKELERSRDRLDSLCRSLTSISPVKTPEELSRSGTLLSVAEKVSLFRSLFRGRKDVYPKRWVSSRTGRSGYSPVCGNEWDPAVCGKTLHRTQGSAVSPCRSCSHRELLPVIDQVIHDHLSGKITIGVYPLLSDETCCFLAADFDKKGWRADISAFRDICHTLDVPVYIEISRSGNGAHAWIFFTEPVPAAIARRMGCFLLTETMSSRPELGFDSYDRLFPNQNTVPKGGFGNLIALPLQHEPRKSGNSVFVDEQLLPYKDQWDLLMNIERMTPTMLETIIESATQRDRVLAVGTFGTEEDAPAPWLSPPSGNRRMPEISGPLPEKVIIFDAQMLFIGRKDLPPSLINRIRRLAAFQNPEFYRKQNLRLSTALTPRIISCAKEFPDYIAIPRGCRDNLTSLLEDMGVVLEIDDHRQEGTEIDIAFRGELDPAQKKAALELLNHDTGIFIAPPGSGKTVVAIYMTAMRRRNTLVIVHRKPLLDQWRAQLAMFLGIPLKEIGTVGAGRKKPNGRIDIAMIQSLTARGSVEDMVAGYGNVIVDECHHLPAVSFERVLSAVKARYITGLTATPQRRDGHQPITVMQLGPVRFRMKPAGNAADMSFGHRLIVRETDFNISASGTDQPGIQEIYAKMIDDDCRNRMICDDVREEISQGRFPLLLTERKAHLDVLSGMLADIPDHLIVLKGGMNSSFYRNALEQLKSVPSGESRLIIATGRYIGEGFDDTRLDTLFLTMPISWKGTLIQYTGRLHRAHPDKSELRIYDYLDGNNPVLVRMFKKRLRTYKSIGYDVSS
jgi:superfamily II DNA or RNA helicase